MKDCAQISGESATRGTLVEVIQVEGTPQRASMEFERADGTRETIELSADCSRATASALSAIAAGTVGKVRRLG